MVWFVETLEKKAPDGSPSGMFTLCASSDEGGGFHVGCSHEHKTHEEAGECEEALFAIGRITGFPYDGKDVLIAKQLVRDVAIAKLTDEEKRALNIME